MTTLVDPPTGITAYAINDHRQVVGTFGAPGGFHAFLWEDGVLTDLTESGFASGTAWDINNATRIVGDAFLWDNGAVTNLGSLAVHGQPTPP